MFAGRYSGTSISFNMAELAFLWKKISKKGKMVYWEYAGNLMMFSRNKPYL